MQGPLLEVLGAPQPTSFTVNLRWGTLFVSQAHFAEEADHLDSLCELTSRLAQGIRAVCERHLRPLGPDVELPEPHWLADVRAVPAGDTSLGLDAQNLGSVVKLADETRMALEDAYAFMRGFSYLPFPGEAYGVLRGTLPGSDVHGRVVVALERPAWENKGLQKALDKKIGGPFGCDTVLVRVPDATPETPGIEGERWIERGRVAISRGVLAAWRPRERMSAQRHEVEALVADTLRVRARPRTDLLEAGMAIRIPSEQDGVIKLALNDSGWLTEPAIAAGQLRQGKAPSMAAMMLGYGLIEVLRPKRSKLLPRHFVLAVTASEVIAFKASGGSGESDSTYYLNISEGVEARFPRDAVSIADIPEGEKSKGGIMTINGESFPVARPNLNGDPNTDELIAVLAGSGGGAAVAA